MTPAPIELGPLGPDAAPAIAELCQRSVADAPDAAAIAMSLFGTDSGPPAVVWGDPDRGVVATVVRRDAGFVRLLVVAPEHRGQGLGAALLSQAEADLNVAQVGRVAIGADAPDYLWPGIDTAETALLCLAERHGYRRVEANLNMRVDLGRLPPAPVDGLAPRGGGDDREEVASFCAQHWPNWADEVLRALDKGSLVISRDGEGVSGFCAWNANRIGWLGPIAVRPHQRSRGTGTPLLLAALHAMAAEGMPSAEIAWVGPIGFYARTVAATVCRVYVLSAKRTREPERTDS